MKYILAIVFILLGFTILYYSQKERLNAYDEWYCVEVYGLDKDCKGGGV